MAEHQFAGDPLATALAAARRGDLTRARSVAEAALAAGTGEAPALHALLGMVCARTGALDDAVSHLRAAHAARPSDVTIACNLIALLQDRGADEAALAIATEALARADASRRIARLRGFIAQKLERYAEAATAYELVVGEAPGDFECWNNLGNARAGMGDAAGAVAALERAVALDPKAAPARLNLASALVQDDRPAQAGAVLRRAASDFAADSRPLYQLYVLLKTQLRQEEAIEALEQAAARDPAVASMQLKLAVEYGAARRTAEAEQAYRRAIALDPGLLEAYLGLAILYEHANRETELGPLLELARGNRVDEDALRFVEALELRRRGLFADALSRAVAIPAEIEPIRVAYLRAGLLDRLGRVEEAFTAFTAANRQAAERAGDALDRAAELREKLRGEIDLLTPRWIEGWSPATPRDGLSDPVFLIGFPRSGTTLLDTFLMGHPQTVVMEEQPPLNIVEDELGSMDALASLDDAAIAAARARYFAEVEKIQPLAPDRVLIDKSPLFLFRIPLIRRLFPGARIILALRHPCDVVLSGFMANFRMNPAMANFLRLEDAAAFYDLCFTHYERASALLPMARHVVRYEDLVADKAATIGPLLEWLGLAPDEALLDHQRTARARGLITTASYSQVAEPIYNRAAGRWKGYARHLAGVFDMLGPWAERLGYEDPRAGSD